MEKPKLNSQEQKEKKKYINPEGADSYDIELSLEEIEKIMENVQDIKRGGVAYSVIGADRTDMLGNRTSSIYLVQKVLREGLFAEGSHKEHWAEDTRKRENIMVYFNIIGRSSGNTEIKKSYWWHEKAIAAIFDISSVV